MAAVRVQQPATVALVAANVAVYVLWQLAPDAWLPTLARHFLVSSASLGRPWTLVLAEFSHVDATHLLFNLIALFSFGSVLERAFGWRTLLALYFPGAIFASLGHVAFGLATGDPAPALGASGAVMAIAVAFAAVWPRARLLVMFFVPVPAGIAVAGFVLLDLLGVFGGAPMVDRALSPGPAAVSIAHAAHLGGAAWGLAWWWFRLRPRSSAHAGGRAAPRGAKP